MKLLERASARASEFVEGADGLRRSCGSVVVLTNWSCVGTGTMFSCSSRFDDGQPEEECKKKRFDDCTRQERRRARDHGSLCGEGEDEDHSWAASESQNPDSKTPNNSYFNRLFSFAT